MTKVPTEPLDPLEILHRAARNALSPLSRDLQERGWDTGIIARFERRGSGRCVVALEINLRVDVPYELTEVGIRNRRNRIAAGLGWSRTQDWHWVPDDGRLSFAALDDFSVTDEEFAAALARLNDGTPTTAA